MVTRATTVSSLRYASPAWLGFTDASERSRLNLLIAGLRRVGYLPTDFLSFEELDRQADDDLLRAMFYVIAAFLSHIAGLVFTLY